MSAATLLLILFVVLISVVAMTILVLQRFVKPLFQQWQSKLEGRYAELDQLKTQLNSTASQDLNRYRDRVRELETTLTTISGSLQQISSEAVGQVKTLTGSLQPIVSMFRTPQVAGIEYAETELELLLKTHLGDSLYERKPRNLAFGGEAVDFVIKLPDCFIPIDSKFPETAYRGWAEATETEMKTKWRLFRDALLRQLETTSKYIRPELGTTDYALLFLPSDVIWQQAFLVSKWYGEENPILRRSQEVRVFGCSVQTLIPYLGLLNLGLRNLKIAEDVKGVQQLIDQLGSSWGHLKKDWGILIGHVANAYRSATSMQGAKGPVTQMDRLVEDLAKHDNTAQDKTQPPVGELLDNRVTEMRGVS